ncbi:hypothetical protein LM237_22895 [Pseudomonas aeruginosa]|uniref:alpha/beta hydrolase n=1 Tax=Pseudomonas aeruginosa TaxID=287 RepID=UPI002148CAFF|nr:hypothetical protein [Pseudomonas aeruginosa]MCQ9787710.1 hypothetical protein [Pseudomonas aeruginosa]
MKTSMPRALLALFCLLASLAHAAPNSILHRPYDLDTGHGVLRGSLLLPRSAVPPPVVLLVAGSGPTDRDGNNPFGGNNRYLLRLAEALAERGIASVRYDKRGVARSLAAAPREEDLSVGVADAEALQRAKPDSQLVLIDGMNHILRIAPSTGLQQLSAYNDPNLPLARQLVEAVSRFILRGAEAEKGR